MRAGIEWQYFQERCQGIAAADGKTVAEIAWGFINTAVDSCQRLLADFTAIHAHLVN